MNTTRMVQANFRVLRTTFSKPDLMLLLRSQIALQLTLHANLSHLASCIPHPASDHTKLDLASRVAAPYPLFPVQQVRSKTLPVYLGVLEVLVSLKCYPVHV